MTLAQQLLIAAGIALVVSARFWLAKDKPKYRATVYLKPKVADSRPVLRSELRSDDVVVRRDSESLSEHTSITHEGMIMYVTPWLTQIDLHVINLDDYEIKEVLIASYAETIIDSEIIIVFFAQKRRLS